MSRRVVIPSQPPPNPDEKQRPRMSNPAPPDPAAATHPRPVESHGPAGATARVFLRGLAITLPSILTVVILIWLAGLVYDYVVAPVSGLVRLSIAQVIREDVPTESLVRPDRPADLEYTGRRYRLRPGVNPAFGEGRLSARDVAERAGGGDVFVPLGRRAAPYADFAEVAEGLPPGGYPLSATDLYMELATERYFGSHFLLSALAVLIALAAIYFIGRLVGVRVGAWLVRKVEDDVLGRLPVISRVYGSVKQVTDFLFAERQFEANRVVAVEYPRKGTWSVGFVTGEGMRGMADAAGEPMYSVLMPTSPMPMTGFTISVPRSACVELDLTIEQAFQFCLSCGVLVPPQQSADGRGGVGSNGASHGPTYAAPVPVGAAK